MGAHTPGPWAVALLKAETKTEMVEYVTGCINLSPDESHFYVVELPDESADICHVGNGPTSAENARLIAAAPRMKTWIEFMLGSDAAPREFPNEGDAQAWYERRDEGVAILRDAEDQ